MWPPGGNSPDVVRLVAWRHGQTRFNLERRFQGQTDVPLNTLGHEQAARAARYVAALRPDAIISSDLARAAETAGYLARVTGLDVQFDKDLRERCGGSWEGLTADEIRDRYPKEAETWTPPDGESASAVADRAAQALERVADSLVNGQLAVVVGHGAALGLGIARVLGIPEELRPLGPFSNCHWSLLSRRRGKWRLLEHNVGMLPEPVTEGSVEETGANGAG